MYLKNPSHMHLFLVLLSPPIRHVYCETAQPISKPTTGNGRGIENADTSAPNEWCVVLKQRQTYFVKDF
jgi:hypothetical protein